MRPRRPIREQFRPVAGELPDRCAFCAFPRPGRSLRTTIVIERCFVKMRRRTRPMVCFGNSHSVDRIVFSIFNRMNPQWKNRTLRLFIQAA
ncbi:MAG TPA: transposase [Terriglobia bacterium]|nr:transposase [Terriglobia bacterium]